jgi:hypothetical protein
MKARAAARAVVFAGALAGALPGAGQAAAQTPAQSSPPPAAPSPEQSPPALDDLRLQARGALADLQLAITVALPAYREAALALIDSFFVIPDVPLEEAADQLMVYLLLPEDRRDPRFALLGQTLQTWPALAQRAAEAGVPLPYWTAHGFDRTRLIRAACIMWGRGPAAYGAAAGRAGVPRELGERCRAFYGDVVQRWDRLLAHGFAADAELRPGRGVVSVEWDPALPDAPGLRALRENATLEAIGEQLTRDFVLPADIVIAVAPCPEPELRWERAEHTIRVCSGLVAALDALIRPAYVAPAQ